MCSQPFLSSKLRFTLGNQKRSLFREFFLIRKLVSPHKLSETGSGSVSKVKLFFFSEVLLMIMAHDTSTYWHYQSLVNVTEVSSSAKVNTKVIEQMTSVPGGLCGAWFMGVAVGAAFIFKQKWLGFSLSRADFFIIYKCSQNTSCRLLKINVNFF